MNNIELLFKSLGQRKRPEDIAETILSELKGDLSLSEMKILKKASRGSLKNKLFGYTSMLQEFASVVGAERQVKKVIELFELDCKNIDSNSVYDIKKFIEEVSPLLCKQVGSNNFVTDRLSKAERKSLGMDISKRSYNKKWRLLKRLEMKLLKVEREMRKVEFQKISKHGIIHHLGFNQFKSDTNTACFIAYYNARCNLRSTFTNGSQARPFDEVCNMLFNRCKGNGKPMFGALNKFEKSGETNWLAIAYIYTGKDVLSNLSDKRKGELLGKWTTIIQEIADLLDEVWQSSNINRKTMIVKRGNDSTTWNNTAGAWNKARDNWMNLIYSLGMDYILDEVCFGKVMRLMAADVAYWHAVTGGRLDPNTEVWNKLPLPWEVFKGNAICNKQMVVDCCNNAGVNAEKSGWIAPRKHGVAKFMPTPELVNGIEVSCPFLATVLKKHKYFSGKQV